jgi:hypothetical protein
MMRRILRPVAVVVPLVVGLVAPSASGASSDAARAARARIEGLDYEDARGILASADAEDAAVALERARLAIYELDCDGATAILARPEVRRVEGGEMLADVAHGCQRVTAALAVDRDEERAIEVRWQDEHDRALAPLLFEAVVRARDGLTRDLGVDWPLPTRIVVVRDLMSLSAMTGLPYESARTTGTVAVAKWGRVTLLSPRASRHGYSWRDTIAHELTHLAVTRASRDQAPLWLQEGVAKREETRWRDPGPFDDRPPADAIVRKGFEQNLALPLDKLGPSIAMLPSADAAMVAFAEVTSFVRFYSGTVSAQTGDALPRLLRELRSGGDPDGALFSASGANLATWDSRWRSHLASLPPAPVPSLYGLGHDRVSAERMRDLRDRSRLAELLLSQGHPSQALQELDRIELGASPLASEAADRLTGDASVRWLRARALEDAGRREEGKALVRDPEEIVASFGPWWATRGRWARLEGDAAAAAESFTQAVEADPLDDEVACESVDRAAVPGDASKRALCEAARARAEPPFDTE